MSPKIITILATVPLLISALGCGGASNVEFTGGTSPEISRDAAGENSDAELSLTAMQQVTVDQQDAATNSDDAPQLERKIIYNATLDLVVESFEEVAASVTRLVDEYHAFIAKSSIDTASGRPRSGSWTIRVPVARYGDFLEAAGSLGELQRRTEDSREVTAEYYDVQTRIRNKQLEEARLRKHLEESTGKLEDILAVEKELSRVRTEVEQLEGQLRVLNDLTALSTVTLEISELKYFVPEEHPTFATQIRRAWVRSIDGLVTAARNLTITAVAVIPWLILIIPLILLGLLWRRRRKRQRSELMVERSATDQT